MRLKLNPIFLVILISLVLVGCSGTPTEAPAPEVQPEDTQPPASTDLPPTDIPPTDKPEPTAEPPTQTPLPEGVLFRDDFEGKLQPGWEWENENPDKWSFTDDGWLQIVGEPESLLGDGFQNNVLVHPLPEGDFVISVHLKTLPFENFHQSTIYIYEDPDNYIAINRGYCDICDSGGGGFYMEYKIDEAWGAYTMATEAEDVYLRLESIDTILSGYYATEPDKWQRLGRFGNYFQFKKVGIGVSNVSAAETVVGAFDYFEISLP